MYIHNAAKRLIVLFSHGTSYLQTY